tara:strand:- start:17063 stop:17656 length:594 start_codon:yes stop_codon:yes gene_type:complete
MKLSYIIWIIIGTGIFGGIINYFRNVFKDKIKIIEALKPILLGLAAAALVPLFLNMISSDLIKSNDPTTNNYLIFLGFCLIASIFSGEFIDSIGQRALSQIDAVQKEIEENNTENDSQIVEELINNSDLTEVQSNILKTFINSRFTYRSISGLAKELNLSTPIVKNELVGLQKAGLVEVVQRKKGPRWRITTEGYKQ